MADGSESQWGPPQPGVAEGRWSQQWEVRGAGVQVYREGVKRARFSPQQIPTGCPMESLKGTQSWYQKP